MARLTLSVDDHSRDSAGMRYVYPVVSRRAGGVSIGINLNPNNACNWRCIYCQVPDLKRGGPPPVDLPLLDAELDRFLAWATVGDFMRTRVPPGARQLMDVAFSGNGEPTSAAEFAAAVGLVVGQVAAHGLAGKLVPRLITNGSLLERKTVQRGIALIGQSGGEVWFKLDAASAAGINRINGSRTARPAWRDACGGAPRWHRPGSRPACSALTGSHRRKRSLPPTSNSCVRLPPASLACICTDWRDPPCSPKRCAWRGLATPGWRPSPSACGASVCRCGSVPDAGDQLRR